MNPNTEENEPEDTSADSDVQIAAAGSEPEVESPPEEQPEEAPAVPEITPVTDDPNEQLTPEQIAAMFAQANGEEPASEEEPEEESKQDETREAADPEDAELEEAPTLEAEEPEETPATPEITPITDDPNEQLTPEQIAAMFAQASGEEPASEEEPEEESKQDETREAADPEDADPEEVPTLEAEEPEETPATPEITPITDDPNEQLTPEQIAAMFAQANGEEPAQEEEIKETEEPESEPAQEEEPQEAADPTEDFPKLTEEDLSQDEISAMFGAGGDSGSGESESLPVEATENTEEKMQEESGKQETDEGMEKNKELTTEEIGQEQDGQDAENTAQAGDLSDIEELDMNDPDAIDKLLGIDAPGDAPQGEDTQAEEEEDVDIEAALKAAMESKEEAGLDAADMELSSLLSDLGDDDPELQEIGELLRKSDEHELVEDEMRALLEEQGQDGEEEQEEKEGIDTGSFGAALGGGGGGAGEGAEESEEDAAQEAIRMAEQLEEEEEERARSKKEGKKKRGKNEESADEDGEDEEPKKGLKGLFAKKKKKKADEEKDKDKDKDKDQAGEAGEIDQMAELAKMDFDGIPEEPEGMDDIAPMVGMGGASEGGEPSGDAAGGIQELGEDDTPAIDAIPEKGGASAKSEEPAEKEEKKKKGKKGKDGEGGEKKGLFAKLFAALTEEVEEEEEEPTPKKKKGKKSKVKDADDNEAILDELDGEPKGKGVKKPKKEKPKKEKKPKKPPKPKKEKKPKPPEEPVKKLPTKMVVLIFIMCISILALVLIFVLLIPPLFEVQSAKKAFEKKEYYQAYEGLIGKKLSEEEEKMFMKSRIVLKFQHKVEAYQHYVGMNMPVEALDSLIEGYMQYDDLAADIDHYEAAPEADAVKEQILTILQNQYHLDEAEIRRIYAQDDYNYTLELEHITGGLSRQNSNYDREANGGLSEINVPEIDFNQVGAPEGGEAGGADGEGGAQDLQDLLPEEEIE